MIIYFDVDMSLDRVKFILNRQKNELFEEDIIAKYIIELLFTDKNKIIFPVGENISVNLLSEFVEIIYSIFNLDKKKRKTFYNDLSNIKKEVFMELSKNDIKDIFGEDDSTEIKSNNSLNNNFSKKLNGLMSDSLKIINTINMNNKDKEELIQNFVKLSSV